jgi:hypothetical protein
VSAPVRRLRPYHLLALLPVIAILGAPWFANRVEPYVLGMPFLLAWIAVWVVLSSVVMAIISVCDSRAAAHAAAPPKSSTRL